MQVGPNQIIIVIWLFGPFLSLVQRQTISPFMQIFKFEEQIRKERGGKCTKGVNMALAYQRRCCTESYKCSQEQGVLRSYDMPAYSSTLTACSFSLNSREVSPSPLPVPGLTSAQAPDMIPEISKITAGCILLTDVLFTGVAAGSPQPGFP